MDFKFGSTVVREHTSFHPLEILGNILCALVKNIYSAVVVVFMWVN